MHTYLSPGGQFTTAEPCQGFMQDIHDLDKVGSAKSQFIEFEGCARMER